MSAKDKVFDVKKFADTRYKGEARSGYSAKGGGIGADVSINPGKIIGLQAAIGINAKVTRADQCMVVVHRGPGKSLSGRKISKNLIVNNFIGVTWTGKAGASLELGVKAVAGAGMGALRNKDGENTDSLYKKAKTFPSDSPRDTRSCSIELLSVGVEAKAGLTLNASGEYSHYYGKCAAPLFFKEYDDMKNILGKLLLASKGVAKAKKEKYKKDAIEFMNARKFHFGLQKNINYKRRMGMGHIPSSELISSLEYGRDKMNQYFTEKFGSKAWPDLHKQALDKTNQYIALLSPSANGTAFINISSKNGIAGLKLGASASAKLSGFGLAEMGTALEANLVNMEYNKTWTHIRFQSHDKSRKLIWTHDTSVVYHNSKISFVSGAAKLYGRVCGATITKQTAKELFKPLDYNWISYKSGIIYWDKKTKKMLKGSGLADGRSFSLENLYSIYIVDIQKKNELKKKAKLMPIKGKQIKVHSLKVRAEEMLIADTSNPIFQIISKSMNVPSCALEAFFNDRKVRFMISELYHKDKMTRKTKTGRLIGSAFIEAGFNMPKGSENKNVKVKTNGHVELDAKSSRELRKSFDKLSGTNRDKLLSCIRLRVRQVDLEDNNHTLFSLGFKIAGTGAKISLEKVDKAAAGGFVELRTVFLKRQSRDNYEVLRRKNYGKTYGKLHDNSVPPVNLYCQ